MESARWNESQLRKYNIKLEKIPILHHDDPKVDYLLKNNVSMIYEYLMTSLMFHLKIVRSKSITIFVFYSFWDFYKYIIFEVFF